MQNFRHHYRFRHHHLQPVYYPQKSRSHFSEAAFLIRSIGLIIRLETCITESGYPQLIPKIGLNAALATVGLTADGAVDVNAQTAAWFNQSSRVGTSNGIYSATFIDGHNPGIFSQLGVLDGW